MANVLPGAGVVEVTFPRRNTDAGLASYSIKSETNDPRSPLESPDHKPTAPATNAAAGGTTK